MSANWFLDHYAAVESACNEPRYVDECVEKTRIPGKFRADLEKFGVTFDADCCHYVESSVSVTLPRNWKLVGNRNRLTLCNENGDTVFEATVQDNRGFQHWTKTV